MARCDGTNFGLARFVLRTPSRFRFVFPTRMASCTLCLADFALSKQWYYRDEAKAHEPPTLRCQSCHRPIGMHARGDARNGIAPAASQSPLPKFTGNALLVDQRQEVAPPPFQSAPVASSPAAASSSSSSSAAPVAAVPPVEAPPRFKLGDVLDAEDTVHRWRIARVIDTMPGKVRIHYEGWENRWDEWIELTSARLAPRGTHQTYLH